MSKASKIRSVKIRKVSEPPEIANRNKTSNPKGAVAEKNAIADNIKSLVASYGFIEEMSEYRQKVVVASVVGNFGKDSHILSKEFNSGYESVTGVEQQLEYDDPELQRVSEGVIVEQNLETGKVKVSKNKNTTKIETNKVRRKKLDTFKSIPRRNDAKNKAIACYALLIIPTKRKKCLDASRCSSPGYLKAVATWGTVARSPGGSFSNRDRIGG
ncbi:hypothetical protein [Okeania sp. KiyG1]|uniref:hypothetical protein n=1 Tax=Okeania sp. KiyG1 TaxID=2720165 RepID=UPI001924EADD|nr:hypothetical protein [Okeania sp. KiyG1]GGA53297.1 hypothetical protein CYANOKiyG1_73370 [Okeania sp. KiyG1]